MYGMKCLIRENLVKMKLSIRGLADKAEKIDGAPSYSTIDNFIRKGTGNLETAWSITQLMELTLNDNFVADEDDAGSLSRVHRYSLNADTALEEILANLKKIEKTSDVATVLLAIGKAISPLGYDEEAGRIIDIGTKLIKINNERGGNDDE